MPDILVLGPVAVRGDAGAPVTPRSRRQRVLLAVFATRPGLVVPADDLVEALWGDALPEHPQAALQSQVHRLRRLLAPTGAALSGDAVGYRLECAREQVDASRFERLVRGPAGDGDMASDLARLEEGLALWRGRAFGDVADVGAVTAEATRLDELRADAEEARAELLLAAGRYWEAESAATVVHAEHPYRERAVAVRMRALAREGRAVDALRLYDGFRRRLGDDLGVEPSPGLQAVEDEILRPWAGRPATVGLPGNSFVGREVELADIAALLDRTRVVTLTGPGGVGKTRLAAHVAARAADRFADGVHLCELASVSDDRGVAGAVAATLRVEEGGTRDLLQRVIDVLRPQQALLVLDNCEHVADGAGALVRAVLARTSGISVLATSRQRLGAEGEHVVPVLPLPTDDHGPAAALFVERARAAGASEPSDADRVTIGRICAALDGLPLAIELAAARSVTCRPAELLDVVTAHLDRLADHRRTVERHRSIEATVGWSYDLLDDDQRAVLRAVAAFVGGWTAPAAAAVAGVPVDDVSDALAVLVDHSLVTVRPTSGSTRFVMLEPVRQYAERRSGGTAQHARRAAHARWATAWMVEADAGLRSADEVLWAAAIDAELGNVRAAHGWCSHHEPETAARLVGALYWYAYWYGTAEVFEWAHLTVEHVGDASPSVAGAFATAAVGSWRRGDLIGARTLAERGIAAAGDADAPAARFAWEALRSVELLAGRYDRALECRDRALALARAAGDAVHEAHARVAGALALGYLARRAEADEELAIAAELLSAAEHPTVRAFHAYVAGEVRIDSDPVGALPYLRRSHEDARRIGNRFLAGVAGVSAASCAARVGDPRAAMRGYPEVLDFLHRAGAWPQLWTTIRALVETLTRLERYEPAAVLHGALTSNPTAPAIVGADETRMADMVATLHARLGAQRLAELRSEGARLDGEQAYSLARRQARHE